MGSESEGHTEGTGRPETGDDEMHPVEKKAAELADGAAESVRRSYDGTKEAYSIDPGQVEADEERPDDQRG
jgi:hypothetical protein